MKKSTILITILISYISLAQNYHERYPKEDVITLELNEHISIDKNSNGLSILHHVNKRNLYLTTEDLDHTEEKISYNAFRTITDLIAFTETKKKNKLKNFHVKDIETKDVLSRGIFYHDHKIKHFFYPNVIENSVTNLKYTKKIKFAQFLPAFSFYTPIPIVKSKVSVSFPEDVEIAYKTYNLDSVDYKFDSQTEKGITTYSWVLLNIEKTKTIYDFSANHYIPEIIVYIKSFTNNGKKTTVLNDAKGLYSWYSQLTKNINQTNQDELKKTTEELIKNWATEEEKIKAIYYHVQDKISYIAFEDGLNGFIPRDASKIYENKYGDCKDMANVLNEMFHYAGIQSYLTWIGTRRKLYSYHDLPTPVTDNHMITTVVTQSNDTLFLDATSKYLPYGYPSQFIQEKEALIGIDENNYVIKKVPATAAKNNLISSTSYFDIENNDLIGNHEIKVTGHNKLNLLHQLKNKDVNDLDFINESLEFATTKSEINNTKYSNLELINDTLSIKFDSRTNNYLKKVGNKIFIRPNFDDYLKQELVKGERINYAKKIEHKSIRIYNTFLNIPDNYTIDFIPENTSISNENFSFSIKYIVEGNTIVVSKEIIINTIRVEPQEISNWNSFIKEINKANKKSITLISQ